MLVSSNHITNFFSLNCRDWIFDNINNKKMASHKIEWQTIFMVTCWHLWMWRNKSIFEEEFYRPFNPIDVILKMATEIDNCKQTQISEWPQHTDTIFIDWKTPQEGWVKLNYDDAHKSSVNLSGFGGLIRDRNKNCLDSYARNRLMRRATCRDGGHVYIGMDMARRQGITHLQVESDFKVLVDMVIEKCNINGNVP